MFVIDVLFFILKIIIFVLIIYGIQYGWDTIKERYTKPKTKYLVNTQLKKYQDIFRDNMYKKTDDELSANKDEIDIDTQEILFNSDEDKQRMNDELMSFMNNETQSFIA